eukprot:362201-Chlamydomonas_euryale.AAC.7
MGSSSSGDSRKRPLLTPAATCAGTSAQVLDEADKIRSEFKEQPQHLDHMVQLIKDLYLDFCKYVSLPGGVILHACARATNG